MSQNFSQEFEFDPGSSIIPALKSRLTFDLLFDVQLLAFSPLQISRELELHLEGDGNT